ncbi:conserved hypothetical protein, membrane [Candidatus Magnetomorum sp. HK-1]|nr:conserved hypothetical protein, membrane [Candidatus Magnetomorum sp. HK-1]
MKKYTLVVVIVFVISLIVNYAYAEKETNNERLIRVEETIKSLDNRFELLRQNMNRQFDNSNTLIYFVLGALFTILGLICALIVMLVRDRQAANKPIMEKVQVNTENLKSIRENINNLENKLKKMWENLNQGKQVVNPV